MKKAIRVITLCLVIVMLTSLLAACKSDSKFVGTWEQTDADCTMVMASDGSGSITEEGISGSLKWKQDGGKLFLTVSLCGMTETEEYTYELSGDTLTLTDTYGDVSVFQKVK